MRVPTPFLDTHTGYLRRSKKREMPKHFPDGIPKGLDPLAEVWSSASNKRGADMKKVYADEKWCLGCGLCMVYCRTAHSATVISSRRTSSRFRGRWSGCTSRRATKSTLRCSAGTVTIPNASQACITGAMQKDPVTGRGHCAKPTGALGCWTCVLDVSVRRDRARRGQKKGGRKVRPLCAAMGEPECVKHCPNNALKV